MTKGERPQLGKPKTAEVKVVELNKDYDENLHTLVELSGYQMSDDKEIVRQIALFKAMDGKDREM